MLIWFKLIFRKHILKGNKSINTLIGIHHCSLKWLKRQKNNYTNVPLNFHINEKCVWFELNPA